jgi:hypothetical protein
MKHLFDKKTLITVLESIKVTCNELVWIHHPITNDLIKVNIKIVGRNKVTVSIPEDSSYFGQPDWEINKTHIIGTVN